MAEMPGPLVVHVDRDLEELIEPFFFFRRDDMEIIRQCLKTGDFQQIRRIGHNLKGAGGGYGFDYISEIGAEIEKAADDGAVTAIEECIRNLERYLQTVEIRYV